MIFLENQKGLFHHLKTRFRMPVKQFMIFGPCQETSYTAITLNPESSFTRLGSPRHVQNRRRRTREGPEPACVQTPFQWGGTCREEGCFVFLPWCRLVGVAIPPVSREGGRAGLSKKGKWPPRGTGTTVLTHPGSAPRGTGKAGENGQHSGEMGGSSAWTRPSAPKCGDTLKALARDQRPI